MKKSKKKSKKYQKGGAEPAAINNDIIDYNDYLSQSSVDTLDYFKHGGVVKSYQSGGGELDGNAVMPFVSFKGDYHNDPSGSRGIALGMGGDNPHKAQNLETRAYVSTDKLSEITGIADAMQSAQAGGMEEMIMQMGGQEAMAGPPQQGMPVQNAPQQPVGQPQDKAKVILGDMIEPESKKEYQELANKLKKIAKNDPNNTRVQDEIKEKMEQLALKQEAQRVMEEQFPDGPPQEASPEQAEALNQNTAMMEMLQGQAGGMQQPEMQQPPTAEQAMDPEAIPLAQAGIIENPYDTSPSINRDMPWKKTNAFDKTGFFTEKEKIAITQDPTQPKYVPSGNPQIEAGRANALNPNGGVSKYNLMAGSIPEYQDGSIVDPYKGQLGLLEGVPLDLLQPDYDPRKEAELAEQARAFAMQQYGDIDPNTSEYLTNTFMQNYSPEMYARNAPRLLSPEADYKNLFAEGQPMVDQDFEDWKSKTSNKMKREDAREDRLSERAAKRTARKGNKGKGEDKDRDGKGMDWAGAGVLAASAVASNIGNIMYLANEGDSYDRVNPERYTVDPELISLDQQRKDIETRMNRVAYENRMKGQSDISRDTFLAGQELQQTAPTYEKEQNVNAQIINSADQFNSQMRMNADDINAQNKAAAQKQYYDSISQIGQNINNLAIDINQRKENAEMYKLLQDYFPNYGYTRAGGWQNT